MKISVITITLNAEDTIEKTIQSVLGQTYSDIEYIIVDGLSTDGTLRVVEKYGSKISKIVSEKDKGLYDAMNKGANMASGDYICFMNSGDTFNSATVVEEVVSSVSKEIKRPDVVYGDTHVIQSWGDYTIKPLPLNMLSRDMIFFHQSSFVSTEVMKKVQFDTRYKICADYNLFHSLYKSNHHFMYLPTVLSDYDISIGSVSARLKKKMFMERMDINGMPLIKAKMLYTLWSIKNNVLGKLYCSDRCNKKRIEKIIKNDRVTNYNLL